MCEAPALHLYNTVSLWAGGYSSFQNNKSLLSSGGAGGLIQCDPKKYIYWLQFKGLNRGPELITFLLHFVMQCLHRQEIMH